MWHLTVRGPDIPLQHRVLKTGTRLALGRSQENDIVLPGEAVSRRHVVLDVLPEGLRVQDLGSRNGTELSGRILKNTTQSLRFAETMRVGGYTFDLEPDSLPTPAFALLPEPATATVEPGDPRTSSSARAPFPALPDTGKGGPAPSFSQHLFQLAEMLASGMPSREFLENVLAVAQTVTGFDGEAVLEQADGSFAIASVSDKSGIPKLLWSSTILQAAVDRRSALLVQHPHLDARFKGSGSVVIGGHRHVLCAPLIRGSRTLGALYLCTRTAVAPNEATVDFISSIAQLAATAVERDTRTHEPAPVLSVLTTRTVPTVTEADLEPPQNARQADALLKTIASLRTMLEKGTEDASVVELETVQKKLERARAAVQAMPRIA